ELFEVRPSPFDECVATLLRLGRHVEQQGGVARQLLHPRLPVERRIEAGLEQPQRERTLLEYLAAPLNRLRLQLGQRYDGVHQAHLQRLLGIVLAAEIADFACLLVADDRGEVRRAETAVEASYLRSGLPKARIVRGDGEIADHVQHVAAADRVASDHCNHRFRQGTNLLLQIEDVQPRHAIRADIPLASPDALVSAGAECLFTLPGEDNDADLRILPRVFESLAHLKQSFGAKRVADLGPIDGDLRDAFPFLVPNVLVLFGSPPLRLHAVASESNNGASSNEAPTNDNTSLANSDAASRCAAY